MASFSYNLILTFFLQVFDTTRKKLVDIHICFLRDNDDESKISGQETIFNESKIQLKQLINLIMKKDEIGVKSWIEKNIQSKKQV